MSSDTQGRLKRLLFLVPYVARNPGQSVDAVCKALGVTREELLEELEVLASLSPAIVEHCEVELDYFTSSCNQTEVRKVQPHELFSHRGQWYLQGFCLSRQDVRLFRLDRIKSLKRTSGKFSPP